jgi:hypothetical protein
MRSLEASRSHTLVTAVAAFMGLAGVLNIGLAADAEEADSLIQQVVNQTTRSGFAVRASRHLEAGSVSGKHRGWMDIDTTATPAGDFSWTVIGEGGSERTRDKVFRAVLETEAQAWRAGARDNAALSLANYQFVNEGVAGDGQTRVRLTPRRADSKLVNGTLIVSADGHPVLLEGKLAKSPSFWVKSVTVVKRYALLGGVSLPVSIESLADVKMVGQASFSMRYRYTSVNGRNVGHSTAATPKFGPSPQIIALHAQFNDGQ